jgi:hypothetical protein
MEYCDYIQLICSLLLRCFNQQHDCLLDIIPSNIHDIYSNSTNDNKNNNKNNKDNNKNKDNYNNNIEIINIIRNSFWNMTIFFTLFCIHSTQSNKNSKSFIPIRISTNEFSLLILAIQQIKGIYITNYLSIYLTNSLSI